MKDVAKTSWGVRPLGEVLHVLNGYAFKSKQFSETDGTPLIRIRDVKAGSGTVVNFVGDYDPQYVVDDGDLLIGMDGEFRCNEWQGGKALLNQRVCKLTGFSDELLPRFLYYGINKYLKEIEDRTAYTTVKHLSSKTIKSIDFPLPPLEEQQRIVAVLDETFEGLARARAHAKANLQNARELFPSSIAEMFSNSGGWETCSVGDLGEVFDGPHATPKIVDHGPLFLGISSLVDGRIELDKTRHVTEEDFAKWTRRVEPRAGDVVFSYETRLGQVGLIPDGMRCCLGRRMGLIRLDESKVSPEFFVAYYLSPYFQDFLRENTVRGATVDRISVKEFPNFPVLLPQKDIQTAVVEQIANLRDVHDSLVDQAMAKVQDLDDLRQSLLQKAFAGELT